MDLGCASQSTVIKIGPKQRHRKIPEGWKRVTSGFCRKGDKFLNLSTLQFQEVNNEDLEDRIPIEEDGFDLLIRKE